MTLAEKIKDLFGKEYNDIDPELLDVKIRELEPEQISPVFNDSYKVEPLRNVFARQTIGVMVYVTIDDIIDIRFEEEVFDTIEELRFQSNKFHA